MPPRANAPSSSSPTAVVPASAALREVAGSVTRMGALLASVLPLALGAAISPTLLALQLLVLAGPTRRLARAWSLTAGSAVVLALYAVAGAPVLRQIHGKSP